MTRRRIDTKGPDDMSTSGLPAKRRQRLHEVMAGHVERGAIPGYVTLLSRHGEVQVDAFGTLAVDGDRPMRRDTIFRLDSLSKPVMAAAAMTLVDDGTLALDDPVDPWLPELADRRVLRAIDGPLDDTVPANRPISLRDLLTMRLGLGYLMDPGASDFPIQHAINDAGLLQDPTKPQGPAAPDEWLRRLGTLPLAHQPGERWLYNLGTDVLGVLLARVTGQPLEAVLRARILDPLGMRDTAFSVPPGKIDRLPDCYMPNPETGAPDLYDAAADSDWGRPPAFPSASGGLVATVDDYHAFGQMLLDGGAMGDSRILSQNSVDAMTTDQITPEQKASSPFFPGFWDDRGWGLGLAVTTAQDRAGPSPGSFGWDGGITTSWRSDPRAGLVAILMTQVSYAAEVSTDFWSLAYEAIDE